MEPKLRVCPFVHGTVRTKNLILYVALCLIIHNIHIISQKFPFGSFSQADKQKKIQELTGELEITNQRCEVYRANLLAVLRDMEEQKLKLSVKVQNARLSLKE